MALEHARLDMPPSAIRSRLLSDHAAFVEGLSADATMRAQLLDDLVANCSVIKTTRGCALFFQADVAFEWFFIFEGAVSVCTYGAVSGLVFGFFFPFRVRARCFLSHARVPCTCP